MDSRVVGQRVRRLRTIQRFGQVDFAEAVRIASGSVSKLENGKMPVSESLAETVASALNCSVDYLLSPRQVDVTTRPWLRAYADASQKAVDRQVADSSVAIELVEILALKRIREVIPTLTGDLDDDAEIEQLALDVRAAARIGEQEVVGNATRAAERLGCVVLPMEEELGRHLGLSLWVDRTPVIKISKSSHDPTMYVPGDRQRFTVAHEVGHLALHAAFGPPETAEDAARVEKQANRFAGAFLVPGDALLDELRDLGGRITLTTLSRLKERWGIAIKALVMRFNQLGVLDSDASRSLYKQISARGWNKSEPVEVENEQAIWLTKAIEKWSSLAGREAMRRASEASGIGLAYIEQWTDWTPSNTLDLSNTIVSLAEHRAKRI